MAPRGRVKIATVSAGVLRKLRKPSLRVEEGHLRHFSSNPLFSHPHVEVLSESGTRAVDHCYSDARLQAGRKHGAGNLADCSAACQNSVSLEYFDIAVEPEPGKPSLRVSGGFGAQ